MLVDCITNEPSEPGSNEKLIWISFVLVNVGILTVALQHWFSLGLLIGRLCEVGGVISYAFGLWRRVKPHGV